jgi:hypothetical protein
VEHLASHPGPDYVLGHDILPPAPAAPPARRPGRVAVAATLSVLLVLLAAGAAFGWTVLHRPDVTLARAFDATKTAPEGSMTMSITATGAAAASAAMLDQSSLRYAWGPGTQQVSVTYAGKPLATVVTTDTHLTLQAQLANLPAAVGAADRLRSLAAGLGPDGQVLLDLADGRPIGVSTGPGSALRTALDKAAKSAGGSAASGGSASSGYSSDQVAALADAISQSVRDNTTVTAAGSDQYGDHYLATLPLRTVAATAWKQVASLAPGLAAGTGPDLSSLDGVTLRVDVWVKDGAVSRVEVPLSKALGTASAAKVDGEVTLVVVLGSDGVVPPAGPVTEVPDSLIASLTGGA